MKRLPLLLFLFTTVALFAQEPGNNLRKTIPQLRQSFPDLIVWGYERGGIQNYKSPEADILFETKNGIVIAEFASIEGEDGYLQGLYQSLLKSFSKNAKTYRWGGNKNSISFFYSYFHVYISYTPNESVSISYDLNQNLWPKQ
jgi:hypothetical protein